jgi:NRAMP (natural resistance-associated macrophage protein)-like metal ion transporter
LLINTAVVATFAHAFYSADCAGRAVCDDGSTGPCASIDGGCNSLGLAQAGGALAGVLGSASKYIWAVALLAAGQASTLCGTLAGQYVMQGFLQLRVAEAIGRRVI